MIYKGSPKLDFCSKKGCMYFLCFTRVSASTEKKFEVIRALIQKIFSLLGKPVSFLKKVWSLLKKTTLFFEGQKKNSVTQKSCLSTCRTVCMKQFFDLGLRQMCCFSLTRIFGQKWLKSGDFIQGFSKQLGFCIQMFFPINSDPYEVRKLI